MQKPVGMAGQGVNHRFPAYICYEWIYLNVRKYEFS